MSVNMEWMAPVWKEEEEEAVKVGTVDVGEISG